jgi:Protein of unknown function (DUF3224)
MIRRRHLALLAIAPTLFALTARPVEAAMTQHAKGTFTVTMQPATPELAPGITRFSMAKQLHGDLEGSSKGEMLAGGDYAKGAAGYVAIEMVRGVLKGKQGSFALQHLATLDARGPNMSVVVVPGSGTGELAGIGGTFTIVIADGKHSYEFEYTLP